MDFVDKIEKEYSLSGLPTAVADDKLDIIWTNGFGNFMFSDFNGNMGFVFNGESPETGLVSKICGEETYTFNIIKTEDTNRKRFYYIFEIVSMKKLDSVILSESVRGYISYLCAKIRTAAGDIISVMDRLFDDVSVGVFNGEYITEGFNRIRNSVMSLEKEVVHPEQVYSIINFQKPDDVINLKEELSEIASEIRKRLKGMVRISEDYDKDIFFRMSAESFETAVAAMASECCMTDVYPEMLLFSAKRSGNDRAEVTIMSVNTDGRPNDRRNPAVAEADRRGLKRDLFTEYMYNMLGIKNGVKFSKKVMPTGCVCKMDIEVIPIGAAVLAERPVGSSGRRQEISDKIAFSFGDFFTAERYYYVDQKALDTAVEEDRKKDGESVFKE